MLKYKEKKINDIYNTIICPTYQLKVMSNITNSYEMSLYLIDILIGALMFVCSFNLLFILSNIRQYKQQKVNNKALPISLKSLFNSTHTRQ